MTLAVGVVLTPSKNEIVHYAIGQRYSSVREDRKRVEMIPIACQETRVFLPRGHKATHSTNITCKVCLEKLIAHMQEQTAALNAALETAIDDKTKFKITLRERSKENLRSWMKNHREPDRETLMRIQHG